MGLKLEHAPLSLQKAVLAALAKEATNKVKQVKPPKKSKYKNKRVLVDGIWFHSDGESKRYLTLKLWERAGIIKNLRLQPKYPYLIDGKHMFTYVADFIYTRDGKEVVEDFKGPITRVYTIKKKIIEAHYGIAITEVK